MPKKGPTPPSTATATASRSEMTLIRLPHGMVMVVGLAWLAPGAEVEADDEHDDFAWWPADVDAWPAEAGDELRRMARALS